MNERKTEDLIERRLKDFGYYSADNEIIVEKQKSDFPRITRLLRNASKSGPGSGKPEFIITSRKHSDFLIVFECKADTSKHESRNHNKYSEYAVDGVLLYASFLSKEYDVLAIAASGQDESSLRISHFLQLQGTNKAVRWDVSDDVISFEEYHTALLSSDLKFRQDYDTLLNYSRDLNDELHAKKITESQRGLLISGILIALKNTAFQQSYTTHVTMSHLSQYILSAIKIELENASIQADKIETIEQSFSFIKTLPASKNFLIDLIKGIDRNVNNFMKTHKYYDVIGQFYVEFLKYANNDKGLGIVLTPHHIAELFVKLSDVNRDSIVFDNCCGTAGLLIAAMKEMISDAKADTRKQKDIKQHQLYGVEFQPNIYTLAVCNMILHDDGKANVFKGDCFGNIGASFKKNPTVGLLNPPYKNKRMKDAPEELEFILNNMEYLDRHGNAKCVAIVPITCATNPAGNIGELKKRILEKHTLEAVLSMPTELFHNSKTTVVTCIMIFTAHRPHPKNKKTWFGYCRDDQFVKTKHLGRIDAKGSWPSIRDSWVQAFVNREVIPGFSVMQKVSHDDEWCVEAYMDTDYNNITQDSLSIAAVKHALSSLAINSGEPRWI
ncbi:N-6 DNA methylase [Candidatus Saccharibacteria bacterium]|nr:N-6 DNA methylase [Candidatus Saccharibacteria bacterium]